MTRRLHILGGGQWQVPTVQLAKRMGFEVLVTDLYEERPAYAFCDHHEVCDIADREATLAVARRHRIDGIVCDTTDVGVPTAAWVAEQLGLPTIGYDVALRFTNKYEMRRLTNAAGIQDVRCELVGSVAELHAAAERIGWPVVVKPCDNQSSRGVHRVDRASELEAAFVDAVRHSRQASVIVEEFLAGIEVTVEGFLANGRYETLGISDKAHFPHRPEVACRLTYPAAFSADVMVKIRAANEAVVRTLGLPFGVTHAEYMVDGERVRLVEIAARGGGSRIHSHIAPYLSGLDVPRAYLDLVTGGSPQLTREPGARAANLEFFAFPSGHVTAIHGVREACALPGVAEVLLEVAIGDTLRPPGDDRARPGLMVVFGKTRDEVLATSEQVKALVRVEVQ